MEKEKETGRYNDGQNFVYPPLDPGKLDQQEQQLHPPVSIPRHLEYKALANTYTVPVWSREKIDSETQAREETYPLYVNQDT